MTEKERWEERYKKNPNTVRPMQHMVKMGRITPQEYREITGEEVPKEFLERLEERKGRMDKRSEVKEEGRQEQKKQERQEEREIQIEKDREIVEQKMAEKEERNRQRLEKRNQKQEQLAEEPKKGQLPTAGPDDELEDWSDGSEEE